MSEEEKTTHTVAGKTVDPSRCFPVTMNDLVRMEDLGVDVVALQREPGHLPPWKHLRSIFFVLIAKANADVTEEEVGALGLEDPLLLALQEAFFGNAGEPEKNPPGASSSKRPTGSRRRTGGPKPMSAG